MKKEWPVPNSGEMTKSYYETRKHVKSKRILLRVTPFGTKNVS